MDGRWWGWPGVGRRPHGPYGLHPGLRRSLGEGQPPREQLVYGYLPGPPSGRKSRQTSWERTLQSTLCWEGPEEVRPAAVSGGGGGDLSRGRLKENL